MESQAPWGPRQKKSGSAGRGPADPLAFVRCLRPDLALGGWGARKPSKPRTDLTRHDSEYLRALRRALDHKPAEKRHYLKYFVTSGFGRRGRFRSPGEPSVSRLSPAWRPSSKPWPFGLLRPCRRRPG